MCITYPRKDFYPGLSKYRDRKQTNPIKRVKKTRTDVFTGEDTERQVIWEMQIRTTVRHHYTRIKISKMSESAKARVPEHTVPADVPKWCGRFGRQATNFQKVYIHTYHPSQPFTARCSLRSNETCSCKPWDTNGLQLRVHQPKTRNSLCPLDDRINRLWYFDVTEQ